MWPDFNELKRETENWLRSRHPNYLEELGEREWMNYFAGKYHSMVIIINYRNI